MDGPHHGLEFVVPAPAAGLELLLEGPGLEAPQDLCVGAFGLTIAPGVCHRGVADLHSKVSTICLEEIASKLRAVVGDDAVGDPIRLTIPLMHLTADPTRIVHTASTSTHLVNLSMAT